MRLPLLFNDKPTDLPQIATNGSLKRGGAARLALRAALLGSTGLALLAGEARADCVNVVATNWQCSGENYVGQAISQDNAIVQTLPGYSVVTGALYGLRIAGAGAQLYFDDNASLLRGARALWVESTGDIGPTPGNVTVTSNGSFVGFEYGLVAVNRSSGAVRVTATGTVEARNADGTGIAVDNFSGGTSVEIQAARVTGGSFGINVFNYGTGATRIAATGLVEATTGIGISARKLSDSFGDIVIDAAAVAAVTGGLVAVNRGRGSIRITATGLVEATDGIGISAFNDTGADGITVEAVDVTGGSYGIWTENNGMGDTSVKTTGTVAGADGHGIHATNRYTAGGLAIEAADVAGGDAGIRVENNGSGVTSVNAAGTVTGATGDGIYVNGYYLTVEAAAVSGGANGIAVVNTSATSTRITATGPVEGAGGHGIFANNWVYSGSLEITAASVTGAGDGIRALSGSSSTLIRTTGLVVGGADGIFVMNGSTIAGNITVEAAAVTGGLTGIYAFNQGTGATRIAATGTVTGASGNGIHAESHGAGLTVEAASVSGGQYGIQALNNGTGDTSVKATGTVTGTAIHGIYASNGDTAGNLTVEANGPVSGGNSGIVAVNDGTGDTSVKATGTVTAILNYGIYAANYWPAGNLTIEAATVTSDNIGIGALNYGTGATRIAATGAVTGLAGILAENYGTALTVEAMAVAGGLTGIWVGNYGTGATRVTATGPVTATNGTGIHAENGGDATGLRIEAASASGGGSDGRGIFALNLGGGSTTVIASGPVEGTIYGIGAVSGTGTADLTVEAASAVATSDTGIGIYAVHAGTGPLSVSASGLVEGGTAAVWAVSTAGHAVDIRNLAGGTLRNASGTSWDAAIVAGGGALTLINDSDIIGTVALDGALSRFENNGLWNGAGGTSVFGGGVGGELVNAAGATVMGAADAAAAELTLLSGLPLFSNHGLVTLADGAAGDVMRIADGAAVFGAGSTLAVDVGGGTDLFAAAGTVDLVGATLAANLTGALAYGARYTVLSAAGGLSGVFNTVTGLPTPTAFLRVEARYDANDAWLQAVKYRDFADAGLTFNQIATGRGLDTMPEGGALFLAVANLPTDAAAQFAFDQLSGEIHASAQTALIEGGRFVRDAVNDRMRAAFGGVGRSAPADLAYGAGSGTGLLAYGAGDAAAAGGSDHGVTFWANAFGSWGSTDGDGNAAQLDRDTSGVLIGVDTPVGDWRVGLVAGYSHSRFELDDRAAHGSSDNHHLGIYAGAKWGDLAFRSAAAYSWHGIETARAAAFPGFSENLTGEYDAATFQAFGELAYGIGQGATRFEPFANLAYMRLTTDGFAETGGEAALAGKRAHADVTFTTLGLRIEHGFALGDGAARLKGAVGWRHALGDTLPTATHAFPASDAFTVAGPPIARDSAVIEVGLDLSFAPGATFGVSYTGQLADDASDHGIKANLKMKF